MDIDSDLVFANKSSILISNYIFWSNHKNAKP